MVDIQSIRNFIAGILCIVNVPIILILMVPVSYNMAYFQYSGLNIRIMFMGIIVSLCVAIIIGTLSISILKSLSTKDDTFGRGSNRGGL